MRLISIISVASPILRIYGVSGKLKLPKNLMKQISSNRQQSTVHVRNWRTMFVVFRNISNIRANFTCFSL